MKAAASRFARLSSLFLRLKQDRGGNFAVMIAVLAAPMMLLLGGAVDTLQLTNAKATLRAATEGAALAAASLTNTDDIETLADQYVRANLPNGEPWDSVEITILTSDVSENSRQIEIMAGIDMQATFLRLAGIETTRVSASSFATQAAQNIEISLVLDISSSMNNGGRLSDLKQAAPEFIDEMLQGRLSDTVSINLVPFGGTVNIGDMFDSYAYSTSIAYNDPSSWYYSQGTNISWYPYRFSNGSKCIEFTPNDVNDDVLPNRWRSQVPHFWVWWDFNPWCPEDNNSVLLNSNNASALKSKIRGITLSDGTGMDIGALWGMKFLSPDWRGRISGDFSNRPADYDDQETVKVMVLMSDGDITGQIRPKDFRKTRAAGSNHQEMTPKGNASSSTSSYTASGMFKSVCKQLQANGVKVFTIGFQIKNGSLADKLLSSCVSNGGAYYHVESTDIGEAFRAISNSISTLRVTG